MRKIEGWGEKNDRHKVYCNSETTKRGEGEGGEKKSRRADK